MMTVTTTTMLLLLKYQNILLIHNNNNGYAMAPQIQWIRAKTHKWKDSPKASPWSLLLPPDVGETGHPATGAGVPEGEAEAPGRDAGGARGGVGRAGRGGESEEERTATELWCKCGVMSAFFECASACVCVRISFVVCLWDVNAYWKKRKSIVL